MKGFSFLWVIVAGVILGLIGFISYKTDLHCIILKINNPCFVHADSERTDPAPVANEQISEDSYPTGWREVRNDKYLFYYPPEWILTTESLTDKTSSERKIILTKKNKQYLSKEIEIILVSDNKVGDPNLKKSTVVVGGRSTDQYRGATRIGSVDGRMIFVPLSDESKQYYLISYTNYGNYDDDSEFEQILKTWKFN